MEQQPQPVPEVTTQLPAMGFPGQNGVHVIVPIFPEGDPRNEGGPGGLPGRYEITFTLSRPGCPLQAEKSFASCDLLEGDSHLEIPSVFRIATNFAGERLVFEGRKNSRGFLAAIAVRLQAAGIKEAHDRAYIALMPALSNFAILWDVPITIYQTDVKELRRGTLQITTRNPFREIALKGEWTSSLGQELMTYAAIYREALITESVTYQFLCFYRLIESVVARRIRLAREAARRGGDSTAPKEIYPRTRDEGVALLNSIFPVKPNTWDQFSLDSIMVPEALGQDFCTIIRKYFRPIRDNIAHTLLQRATELISTDDPLSRSRVERWLPPIKCVVRAMLKRDFHYLMADP